MSGLEPASSTASWSNATRRPELIAVYGTSTHEPTELARLIAGRLGVRFAERESYYRGIYLAALLGEARIEVQPNAVPGDDDETDLYAGGHPDTPVLVLVSGTDPDGTLSDGLAAINGLAMLESWCT